MLDLRTLNKFGDTSFGNSLNKGLSLRNNGNALEYCILLTA